MPRPPPRKIRRRRLAALARSARTRRDVSRNHPHKDYAELQDRYALVGTRELVVFDPFLAGPSALGGPALLQLWRRDRTGMLERVVAGKFPRRFRSSRRLA